MSSKLGRIECTGETGVSHPTCSGKLRSRIKDKEPSINFATKEWVGEEEAALVAGMDQLGEVVEEGSRKI